MNKKILITILVIVAISIAGTFVLNALLTNDNTSQSKGTLVFQSDMAGVSVTIFGPEETFKTGTTGNNNQLTITNLPGGSYRGIATKDGYLPSEIMGISLTSGGSATIMVSLVTIQPTEPVIASTNPNTITVKQGNSGTLAVTLTSQQEYEGLVSLNCYGLPTGVTAAFNPAEVTLNAGSVGSLTMTLTVSSTTPKGVYSISWGVMSGYHEGSGLGFLLQVT